ncbi:ankyrin repeat protein, partial [Trichoderma virens Gv29-8]
KDRTKPDQLSNIQIEIQRNIIQRLSVYTLGRLAMVSRFYYGLATPVQYKKDACDEPPRAILWAASCTATPDTKKIIKKVLDLAVVYGGNVNRIYPLIVSDKIATYTPLHLAAAKGNKTAAKKLLKLGADPNALGWEFFRDTLFSPSMASPVDPGTINLLHILSALPKEKFTKDASLLLYFRNLPQLINIPIMAGLTPLFLSIHRGNDILLKEIMTNGGNIEDVNYIGRTPLMQAIVCCCMKEDPEVRICYKGIISNMIECFNAKVGNLGDADVMETPLICIIKELPTPLPTDWKHRIQDIKEIIDLLLKHGADINEVSNAGFTMLHVL